MRRREDRAIRKHTLNLYDGDYEKLQNFYPARIGAAKIIRDVIHAHVRKIEEGAAQRLTPDFFAEELARSEEA
jgi:hypothetical protein